MAGRKSIYFLLLLFLWGCIPQNYKLNLIVDDVQNLDPDAPVTYNGLRIGHVDDIKIHGARMLVELSIDPKHQVPANSQFVITTRTIFGRKHVEIRPSANTAYYAANDTVTGESEMSLMDVFSTGRSVMDSVVNDIFDSISVKVKDGRIDTTYK